jgi:hypothetical protein
MEPESFMVGALCGALTAVLVVLGIEAANRWLTRA